MDDKTDLIIGTSALCDEMRKESRAQGIDFDEAVANAEEFINVLEEELLYEKAVNALIENGGCWCIFSENDELILADCGDEEVVPMWLAYDAAAEECCEEWEEFEPEFISLYDLLEQLLPELEEDNMKVMLVRDDMEGSVVASGELANDLKERADETEFEELQEDLSNVIPFPKLQ